MNPLKPILLVEDSKNDVELTLAAFQDCHIANPVIVLHDGVEVLDYFRRARNGGVFSIPVVVLLDVKMPRLDGLEVLRQLKADDKLKKVPVVMLTSSREGPDIDECYRLGANAYVVKPVASEEFFQAIKDVGRFWAVVNQPPLAQPVAGMVAAKKE